MAKDLFRYGCATSDGCIWRFQVGGKSVAAGDIDADNGFCSQAGVRERLLREVVWYCNFQKSLAS